jgi:Cu+-exporting ATPase
MKVITNLNKRKKEGIMAKDPVCGMAVDESKAIKVQKDNATYYFCSTHCKEKFLSVPVGEGHKEKSGGCCG